MIFKHSYTFSFQKCILSSALQTPSLKASSTEDKEGSGHEEQVKVVTPSPEECRNLFNTDPNTFHVECCLKAGADIHLRDHRCTLKKLLEKAEAGKKGSVGY